MIGAFLLSVAACGLVFASTIGDSEEDYSYDMDDCCITDSTPRRSSVANCLVIKEDRR